MKIVFVATHVWPAIGGTESFLHHLAGELSDHHDVKIVSLSATNEPASRLRESLLPPPRFAPFDACGASTEQLRIPLARRAMLAPLVAQVTPVLRRFAWHYPVRSAYSRFYAAVAAPVVAHACEGADVVHHWGTGLLCAATERAARTLGVPCAITPFMHVGQWSDDRATASVYCRYDRVFALLESEAESYRRLGVRDIFVGGVCTPGLQRGAGARMRADHGIDGPVVLFLGERRAYKGFDLLADAARDIPDATFVFAGAGPQVSGPNVIDVGRVSDEDRERWLDAADMVCLPSEAEILPSTFLEAWSVGTPFLASDIPPLRELADTGGGFVVAREAGALRDRIKGLLSRPAELRAAGQRGFEVWRERYTPHAVGKSYVDTYRLLQEELQA